VKCNFAQKNRKIKITAKFSCNEAYGKYICNIIELISNSLGIAIRLFELLIIAEIQFSKKKEFTCMKSRKEEKGGGGFFSTCQMEKIISMSLKVWLSFSN